MSRERRGALGPHGWTLARHVISLIHPENTPSMKVAERLGETREGAARVNEIDVLVYGIDRP